MDDNKLFLLDAYALIYRAYYALIRTPRITSKGFNTSAIFGFCNTIDEILRKENPSHIAVCFDPPHGCSFRKEIFPEYKAQRDAQPEDITLSIPYIKQIIEAYNIPVIEVDGYEADDVIGTLSRQAEERGFTTFMMTPDKDYGQLVTDRIVMYRPSLRGKDFEIRGVKEVCERYGIERPSQVIDLLALEGDASDNIPGCPGVGEKTAVKLIGQFGSVENMLANIDEIKGALKDRIARNSDKILLSKDLATIRTDAPVEVDFETLRREPEDVDRLVQIYKELEFKTFIGRLTKKSSSASSPEPPTTPTAKKEGEAMSLFDIVEEPGADAVSRRSSMENFEIERVDTLGRAGEIIANAVNAGEIGFAPYAVGDDAMTARLKGVAIALDKRRVAYLVIPDSPIERQEWAAALEPLFSSAATMIDSHDVKRDILLLRNIGIDFKARYNDTSVAHYLLQPEMRHRLSDIAFSSLGYQTIDHLEESRSKKAFAEIDDAEVAARIGEQAALVLALCEALSKELADNDLTSLYEQIELPMVRVLADMEITGVRIDVVELNELSKQLTEKVNTLLERVYEIAGRRFNVSSPAQVGEVLFGDMKLDDKAKRTKKGAYSTTEEILEKLRHHEIVDLILKIRGLNKLLATYINALPTLINPATGKIHTTYNQTVTATGRLSSANPNLQNIPVRTDDGREIRRAFIPDPGCLLLSADYSQIELRLMADASGDPDMVAAFRSGADIHRATAAKIYHVAIDDVTDDQRRKAKTANFGIIYGISAFGLSERLAIPRAEAQELIKGYFRSYPHIKDYIDNAIATAREREYVTTVKGRRRLLPDINSRNAVVRSYAERNAVNAPLQGSAADIIKIAMIRIFERFEALGLKSKMIMQVHDELIFNVAADELPFVQQIVVAEMTEAYHGKVDLEVASGVGRDWLEAH